MNDQRTALAGWAGEAKRQQGGVRNKTKDRTSLEWSERRGFCFVGKGSGTFLLQDVIPGSLTLTGLKQ